MIKYIPSRDMGSILGLGRFPWSRKWQPTLVFLPGEFHGQKRLAGYSPWDRKESDMTEHLTHTLMVSIKMMNPHEGQQWRCRHREQTCGRRGGNRGWDKLRE